MDSDIPPAAGNVVRRALEAEAGVTRLEQLTAWSRRELLALHGIGPKGFRILVSCQADPPSYPRPGHAPRCVAVRLH
jgi:hypothetical protein